MGKINQITVIDKKMYYIFTFTFLQYQKQCIIYLLWVVIKILIFSLIKNNSRILILKYPWTTTAVYIVNCQTIIQNCTNKFNL